MSISRDLHSTFADDHGADDAAARGFVYDEGRFERLEDARAILEQACHAEPTGRERIVKFDAWELIDNGVNPRALAQRLVESNREDRIDIEDIFTFLATGADVASLNSLLKSDIPNELLSTALESAVNSAFEAAGALCAAQVAVA